MEKKAKNGYGVSPWMMKKQEFSSFIPVTEMNRKTSIVIGRILYVIDTVGVNFKYCGAFVIDPHFKSGQYKYPFMPWHKTQQSHFILRVDDDMDYAFWKATTKMLVDYFILEKKLFLKTSDPILKFYKI